MASGRELDRWESAWETERGLGTRPGDEARVGGKEGRKEGRKESKGTKTDAIAASSRVIPDHPGLFRAIDGHPRSSQIIPGHSCPIPI